MKINKIVLYNFNSFEGLNEFDFTSDDSSKNIILIGGKNGAGKSTMIKSILGLIKPKLLYMVLYHLVMLA